MKWKNVNEIPDDDQLIWCMLNPHKKRGSLLQSAASIQIVCGWYRDGSVENADELGSGNITWSFSDFNGYEEHVIAWMPVHDLILPYWENEE